jgi:hypothetical protein
MGRLGVTAAADDDAETASLAQREAA